MTDTQFGPSSEQMPALQFFGQSQQQQPSNFSIPFLCDNGPLARKQGEQGEQGLISCRRGKPSNNRLSATRREELVNGQQIDYKVFKRGEQPKPAEDEKALNHRVDQAVKQRTHKPKATHPRKKIPVTQGGYSQQAWEYKADISTLQESGHLYFGFTGGFGTQTSGESHAAH